MVASLMINTQKLPKEVEATMKPQKQNIPFHSPEEIMNFIHEEVKKLVKNLLEILMFEERKIYLEEQEDSGNGFYTRNLLTNYGEIESLRVPRVRKGSFRPVILPERRKADIDLTEVVINLYEVGVSTRKISQFLERIYGSYYSPQSISRLIKVAEEEVKAWKERPLSEEYFAIILDGSFLSIRRSGVKNLFI